MSSSPEPQKRIRILVVHADPTEEEKLAAVLGQTPNYQGIPARLSCSQHDDEWLVQVKEKAIENCAHLVLIEYSCVGKKQRLEQLQQELTPIQCVLHVGSAISAERAMCAFLDRLWLAPPLRRPPSQPLPLGAAVDRAFRRLRAPSQSIAGKQYLEEAAEKIGAPLDEVEELMAYLFPEATELHVGLLLPKSATTSVVRGRSMLLSISADRRVDQVLKLVPRDRAVREATNYSGFVDGRLIGTRHAVLERWRALWHAGGLVYSLIGAGGRIPPPFSTYFRSNTPPTDRIDRVLKEAFGAWSRHYAGHYSTQGPRATDQPLFVQYNEVWGNKLERKLTVLQTSLPPLPPNFGFLLHPVRWLGSNAERSAAVLMRKAVTHGDFHADNILVDDDGHCWLLEFERTGLGPILQDFAELETDLLTRLTEISLEEFFLLCVGLMELARPEAPVGPAIWKYVPENRPLSPKAEATAQALITLRFLAREHTRFEDSRELLWGLLLNVIYALSLSIEHGGTYEHELQRRNQLLVLGAVISQRLDRWTDYMRAPDWPPREWEGILSSRAKNRVAQEPFSHPIEDRLELRVTIQDRTLNSTLHRSGYSFKTCGRTSLEREPREILGHVFGRLSSLARKSSGSTSIGDQRTLDTIGHNLYDELFTSELKQEYATFRKSHLNVMVISDDPWIPWEMVKPYSSDWNDPPLCEQFFLTRWLSGHAPLTEIIAPRVAIVRPPDNLQAADQELEYFNRLPSVSRDLVGSVDHLSKVDDVLSSFREGRTNLYHFACHGNFDQSDPNESRLRLEEGFLSASQITGNEKIGLSRAKPVVFLNACHTGRLDFGLTRLGGWAKRFIEAGAIVFLGTMWEVNDSLAAAFAVEFYDRLLGLNGHQPMPLAQAVHGARMEIKSQAPANPTWLAYVVYGDPKARVVFRM
ncbi:MAG: CHAT domain-containing protein [Candidatus Hadarchaeum sp.]